MLIVPLLREIHPYPDLLNGVLVVVCAKDQQTTRRPTRSALAGDEVLRIIRARPARAARLQQADDVLD